MQPPADPDLRTLFNLLQGAAVRSLRRQNTLAIATSGGLDSSLLAALIAQEAEVPVHLVVVSAPGAPDGINARRLARHLDLPLTELVLNRAMATRLLDDALAFVEPEPIEPRLANEWGLPQDARRVNPVRTAVSLVLLGAAREARRVAQRLVLGQGADEWFGGYARYATLTPAEQREAMARDRRDLTERELPLEARIADAAGVQFHYPYLNDRVTAYAGRLDPESLGRGAERKRPLRELGRWLGLPDEIVSNPKTAAQYGSGAADHLRAIAQEAGLAQNEYLTARALAVPSLSKAGSA